MATESPGSGEQSSPLKRIVFGSGDQARSVTEPGNQKRLLAGSAMKVHRQKTLRETDILVERRMPLLRGGLGTGIIVADNDPTDPGLVFDLDPSDAVISVDIDPRDGSSAFDTDVADL